MSDSIVLAASLLRTAREVAVLTGAGISAESGLPTFRGSEGLWRGLDPMQVASREALQRDPELVWQFYHWRRELLRTARPNPGHLALVQLAAILPRLALITQNVDRLHQLAGSADVIELHGNLQELRCMACGMVVDRADEPLEALPTCSACGGLLRPAVVLFGEMLPPNAWQRAAAAVRRADAMLVVGTSAAVYPAAGLIDLARESGARMIEINPQPAGITQSSDLCLVGPAGSILPRILSAMQDAAASSDIQ
jgi:NAD-dependent deacetylase